jgi:hypothetical protein
MLVIYPPKAPESKAIRTTTEYQKKFSFEIREENDTQKFKIDIDISYLDIKNGSKVMDEIKIGDKIGTIQDIASDSFDFWLAVNEAIDDALAILLSSTAYMLHERNAMSTYMFKNIYEFAENENIVVRG